jgi:hypothetical protein
VKVEPGGQHRPLGGGERRLRALNHAVPGQTLLSRTSAAPGTSRTDLAGGPT